jgi:hypothetical protein
LRMCLPRALKMPNMRPERARFQLGRVAESHSIKAVLNLAKRPRDIGGSDNRNESEKLLKLPRSARPPASAKTYLRLAMIAMHVSCAFFCKLDAIDSASCSLSDFFC